MLSVGTNNHLWSTASLISRHDSVGDVADTYAVHIHKYVMTPAQGPKQANNNSPGHRPTGVLDPSSYLFLFRLPTVLLTFCLFELVNYRFSSYHGKRAREKALPWGPSSQKVVPRSRR